jgi:hypothetical protein
MIGALCCSDCGSAWSWIWITPDVRTSSSQAGVPGVRAWFISPNRKDPSAFLVTWLDTVRGGLQVNGKYAMTMSTRTIPTRATRHTAVVTSRAR